MYVELHARSAFSFLEGTSLPELLMARCAQLDIGKARNGFVVVVQICALTIDFPDLILRDFSKLAHLALRSLASCAYAGDEIKRMFLFVVMIEIVVVCAWHALWFAPFTRPGIVL